MNDPASVAPSAIEEWLDKHVVIERLDSAGGLYERMPRQRGRQLPFVDVPYDPRREDHWADAARVADYLAHAPDGARVVLDVGPGDGWPSLPMAAERLDLLVIGVDPSPLRAATCRVNGERLGIENAVFLAADAAVLPLADGSVDLVTASQSLEEATAPEEVFAELRRVLRPGGVLRASYQRWELPVPEIESVWLWEGVAPPDSVPAHYYSYVRRVQAPALERRYTLELPYEGEAAELHQQALEASAAAPRAYGETLLTPAIGLELLPRLAPLARRAFVVELRRWTTAWLVQALREAGFEEVRATAHPGEFGRRVGRELIARGEADGLASSFEALAHAMGVAGGSVPGDEMVVAVRS